MPSQIAALVSQYKTESHKQEGKQLHQLVAKQTQAKSALARIETERAAYDKAWAEYIDRLTQLIQDQFAQREKAVQDMDVAAEAWTGQLKDASKALAESAGSAEAKPDMEIDEAEEMVTAAVEQESRRRQVAEVTQRQHFSVIEALRGARESVVSKLRRDSSRTPRRRSGADIVDSSPELEAREDSSTKGLPKGPCLPPSGAAGMQHPQ